MRVGCRVGHVTATTTTTAANSSITGQGGSATGRGERVNCGGDLGSGGIVCGGGIGVGVVVVVVVIIARRP